MLSNRQQAKANGHKHYNGRLCKTMPLHGTKRFVSNAHCVRCLAEQCAASYDKRRVYPKGGRPAPKRDAKAKGEKWYVGKPCPKHPGLKGKRHIKRGCLGCHSALRKDALKRWRAAHPGEKRECELWAKLRYRALRKPRFRSKTPEGADKEGIVFFYAMKPDGEHVDHIRALWKGKDTHILTNLQYLDKAAHTAKTRLERKELSTVQKILGRKRISVLDALS